jgi:hypothetical protein
MSAATLAPSTDPPLSDSHHRELALAAQRSRSIQSAARVANFNAWTTAILAALSAPFALFSLAGIVVFVGLAVVAWNEFRGRRRMLDYDPAGASILGWNQVGLLALISVYCLWAIYSNLWGSGSIESQWRANPQLGAAFGSLGGMSELVKPIILAFYGTVIALTAIFQGGNALYYFTRRKYLETYVRETPAWVIDLQRATRSS